MSFANLDLQAAQLTPGHKRTLTLAALACALAVSGWLLTLSNGMPETPIWADALYPLFDFAAALMCFRAARSRGGSDYKAWFCFGLACAAFGAGEVVWGIYEVYYGIHVPTPSLADVGYIASMILFIPGIWYYHDAKRSTAFTLVQVGNMGIIFSAIVLGYVFVFQGTLSESPSLGAALVKLVYGVGNMAALCFGLVTVSLHLSGRKRIVLALIVAGLAGVSATYFSFIYRMLNNSYAGGDFVNLVYLIAFSFIYWAAFEHQNLPADPVSRHGNSQEEDRAGQWETLLPAAAVAAVGVAAFAFRELLSEALLPYVTIAALFFVASLALRNWWGHSVETRLRHQAMASQAQLRKANEELREEMQARAQVQEELRQSQKMDALGQLTGGVAHDFNNLLAVVMSNLEMAQDCAQPGSDLHEFLVDANDAAERGASLTQRLLALSRKQALKPESLEVDALLVDMQSLLERSLGERIRVRITAADATSPCAADRAQLESAILNLAINARDAMPHGGELDIETANVAFDEAYEAVHPDVAAGCYVVIAVRDSGTGIEREILTRVFDPFFTTKGVGEGTGLGLSMVYGFAKQSGGHVAIDSEPGTGTVVRLYLPATEERRKEARPVRQTETPRGRGESVLVVEDEPAVRKLVTTILENLGYKVVAAEDGVQALDKLDGLASLDLLLSDVVLPGGLSGRELARNIAARRPEVSVLLMSGYAAEVLLEEGDLAPGTDLLHKPFRTAELASKVRAALDGREPTTTG